MSKSLREVSITGRVENIRKGDEIIEETDGVLYFDLVSTPKWIDESGEKKQGRENIFTVKLEDPETIEKYKKLKAGHLIYVEYGNLKNHRWKDAEGLNKKKIIITISKYEGFLNILSCKEDHLLYINRIMVVGDCFKCRIRRTREGKMMGIFPILTKKFWKDTMTAELKEEVEWIDITVFNEKLLRGVSRNLQEGDMDLSRKTVVALGVLTTNQMDQRVNINVSKKGDKLLVIDNATSENYGNNQSDETGKKDNNDNDFDDLPF